MNCSKLVAMNLSNGIYLFVGVSTLPHRKAIHKAWLSFGALEVNFKLSEVKPVSGGSDSGRVFTSNGSKLWSVFLLVFLKRHGNIFEKNAVI